MATTKEKVKSLIDSLFQRTSNGSVQWSSDEWGFVSATIGASSLNLYESRNDDGEPIVVIKILVNEKVVDSFDDDFLAGIKPPIPIYQNYYLYMKELYSMASRQATGADAAIDGLISDLDGMDY